MLLGPNKHLVRVCTCDRVARDLTDEARFGDPGAEYGQSPLASDTNGTDGRPRLVYQRGRAVSPAIVPVEPRLGNVHHLVATSARESGEPGR